MKVLKALLQPFRQKKTWLFVGGVAAAAGATLKPELLNPLAELGAALVDTVAGLL